MYMRNKNTKIKGVVVTALLVLPMFAFAEDTSTWSTEVSSWTTNTESVQVPVSESIVLKGKIEGYKVILSWTPYTGSTELAGYKIIVTNPNGETQIQSVGREKTTADNWQGKPWNNVFQIFAMSGSAELLVSNKVELRMWPNGNYDFGTGSFQPREPIGTGSMQPREPIGTGSIQPREPYKVPQTWTTTSEQRTKFDEIMKALEVEIIALRSTITPNNHDEIKQKAEALKASYIAKLEPLGIGFMKNAIEYRFQVFYQNNFSGSWSKLPERNDERKYNNQTPQNQNGLVAKYKAKFTKSLDAKLSTLSVEKMKSIVTKIDWLIAKYQTSDLEETKKNSYIAQLTALRSLLQDKIDDAENTLNIDDLLQ